MIVTQNPLSSSTCIICLNDNELIKFNGSCKCTPSIHSVCLNQWLEKNPLTCPICRKKFKEKKYDNDNYQNDPCHSCCMCGFLIFIVILIILRFANILK